MLICVNSWVKDTIWKLLLFRESFDFDGGHLSKAARGSSIWR